MRKRTTAFLTAFILILSFLPVAVAETPGPAFEIRTVAESCITAEFTADLWITGNPEAGIAGAVLELEMDEVFSLVKVEKGPLCVEEESAFVVWEGEEQIAFASPENTYGDGALLRLTFRVADTVPTGDYTFKVSVPELKDGNLNNLTAEGAQKTIRVLDYLWGDANRDKQLGTDDVVTILKWKVYALQDEDLDLVAADADCDGTVTLGDAILLLRYLAGTLGWAPNGLS